MKNTHQPIPKPGLSLLLMYALFMFVTICNCSAQNIDPAQSQKKRIPYTLKVNKGSVWIGGSLGISGSVVPMGQYIGTAATVSAKGGYHVIDKLSVGLSITGGFSIANKKTAGIYNKGVNMLIGPIVQYYLPVSKNIFLAPIIGATWGPMYVKSLVSAAGEPQQFVKIKGHAFCELAGIGPFFEVIPGRADFGAQFLVSSIQQTTNLFANNGDKVPGTEIKDRRTGPAMVMEFRLHF